jgi:hypothetical protein
MKEIPLTHGQVAMVDDADYDWLMQWDWKAQYANNTHGWYAVRYDCSLGECAVVRMHRVILGAKKSEFVDHIHHNGLDNRRTEIRLCTFNQNGHNRRMYLNNTTGFKGVSYEKQRDKYRARLQVNGKMVSIGRYLTPELAAAAYDAAAIKYFGEFALTNAMIATRPN